MRRARAAAFGGLVMTVLLAGACSHGPKEHAESVRADPNTTSNSPLSVAVLTADGVDRYALSHEAESLTMRAGPGNTGSDLREVIWPRDNPVVADSQSCATWTDGSSDQGQQGLAFRIVQRPTYTLAVTITRNVFGGASWIFNVHTWDSSDPLQPFTLIAQFDMSAAIFQDGNPRPFPWRVCGRLIANTAELKVWFPDEMAEPKWGDTTYTKSTSTIPRGYRGPGRTGWYVGHLPPSGTDTYRDLNTWSLVVTTQR